MEEKNEEKSKSQRALTIIGIVLCVIMVPFLLINVTLIIKSYTNPDDVPSLGGWSPMIVLSPSMEPNIMTGDLIFVKQVDPSEVKEGDVISFFDPESNGGTAVLTHRVVEVITAADGTRSFRTKGDNNNADDRLAAPENKLIGTYRFRLPGLGNVAMFMQTTAGLVVCVVVPLILLVGWDIFRRKRHEAKNQQDTDALLAELEALRAAKAAEAAAPAVEPKAEEPAEIKEENPAENKDSQ